MRRDEPNPSLPAWLQDEPSAEITTTEAPSRRGFRRGARSGDSGERRENEHREERIPSDPPVPETSTPQSGWPVPTAGNSVPPSTTEPVASVPMGMVVPPASESSLTAPTTGETAQTTGETTQTTEPSSAVTSSTPVSSAPGPASSPFLFQVATDMPEGLPPVSVPDSPSDVTTSYRPLVHEPFVPEPFVPEPVVTPPPPPPPPAVAAEPAVGAHEVHRPAEVRRPAESHGPADIPVAVAASRPSATFSVPPAEHPVPPAEHPVPPAEHPVPPAEHIVASVPSNPDLASGVLVRRRRRSTGFWKAGVDKLTGGRAGGGVETDDDLVARIRQPVAGVYRVAVLSLKGGVGKTTTTIGLGSTFASLRGDCVIAVDANPDFGTLAQRIPRQTDATVRDLLAAAPTVRRYSDVRAHTSQAPSRLEVLASERDPATSEAFSEADYRAVVDILELYYNIVLTDCGTGIMHSAMRGVLDLANALVLVASPAVDAARSAAATLDWLQAHDYGDLVERTVVVISSPRPGSANIDMDAVTRHFLDRCRAVSVVPFDEHLAEGAEIHLDRLRPATRRAFAELAAMVADDFPALTGRHAGR